MNAALPRTSDGRISMAGLNPSNVECLLLICTVMWVMSGAVSGK